MEQVQTKNIETLAYVVHGAGEPFKLEQVTLDALAPDELLVDIQYSGICATDLGFQAGKIKLCPYPAIFGHEGAGKILAIGDKVQNKDWKVGDRVLLSMNYCQKCKFCKSDHPADCVEGTRLHLFGLRDDGTTAAKLNGIDVRFHFFGQSSFAKRSFVHETCVVKVPEGVKDEDIPSLAAMGCGYQTGISKPSCDSKRK
jgi:Zn-dependent alcohol dehydrogenase